MSIFEKNLDRRTLLVGGVSIFGGMWLLGREARAQSAGGAKSASGTAPARTLLLLELNGGNDGLSWVVPYAHDVYHRSRKRTGLAAGDVLRLDDYRGFHPNLKKLREVYGDGHMAIVEGVG